MHLQNIRPEQEACYAMGSPKLHVKRNGENYLQLKVKPLFRLEVKDEMMI